jgi:hypothetical protein
MNNRTDWDNSYPPTPSEYHEVMMKTLNSLEETCMKIKHKTTLTLIAALVAIIIMSTVVLATINHFGILDFFGRGENALKPMDGVKNLIEHNLGSAENELVHLTIREAMYDGYGIHVVAAISPIDKEKHAIVDDIETPVSDGMAPIVLNGATIMSSNAQLDDGYIGVPSDQFVMEDGALVQNAEGILYGDAPDTIHLTYTLRSDIEQAQLSISFDLQNRAIPRTVVLSPITQGEDFRIVNAMIIYTHLAAYLDVTYEDHMPILQDELFDVPDGIYYGLPGAKYFHSEPNCSGMANAKSYELSELLERGKHACPVCLGALTAPDARMMYFALLDRDRNEISSQNSGSSQVGDEMNGVRIYHQISILQTSDMLPDKVFLQPMEGSERINIAPIECEVIK